MKNALLLCSVVLLAVLANSTTAQDMPQPLANYQLLPAGSLVIAMDNTTQANSTNNFNLKAYGLIDVALGFIACYRLPLQWKSRMSSSKGYLCPHIFPTVFQALRDQSQNSVRAD